MERKKRRFGKQPVFLEKGICSLVTEKLQYKLREDVFQKLFLKTELDIKSSSRVEYLY